jgi:hypothetical protein
MNGVSKQATGREGERERGAEEESKEERARRNEEREIERVRE